MLLTRGVGVSAFLEAAQSLFKVELTFEGVEVHGRTDPLIWQALAKRNGIEDHEPYADQLREGYHRILKHRVDQGGTRFDALAGAAALIKAVGDHAAMTAGLLTGNFQETGEIKLHAAGFDPAAFEVCAWGADAQTRRGLPPVAMKRFQQAVGRSIAAHEVVIIGDTTHDIDCARANGCWAIAVATGGDTKETLAACEPDLLVDDLSDTAGIMDWILARADSTPV